MRLGVTGTVKGATLAQAVKLWEIMASCEFRQISHGDAVGVDALAHRAALAAREFHQTSWPRIILHPPINESRRAFSKDADEVRNPKGYLARDKSIVEESDMLIAVPDTAHERVRSGTWTTVRYARKLHLFIIRINPDGDVKFG